MSWCGPGSTGSVSMCWHTAPCPFSTPQTPLTSHPLTPQEACWVWGAGWCSPFCLFFYKWYRCEELPLPSSEELLLMESVFSPFSCWFPRLSISRCFSCMTSSYLPFAKLEQQQPHSQPRLVWSRLFWTLFWSAQKRLCAVVLLLVSRAAFGFQLWQLNVAAQALAGRKYMLQKFSGSSCDICLGLKNKTGLLLNQFRFNATLLVLVLTLDRANAVTFWLSFYHLISRITW